MENQTLHQKNLFLTKHYEGLKLKYDEVIVTNSKLQKFEPSFIKLQEKLPNYSVEKLIDKFEYLENINMNFVKKISEYEDDKIQIERENQKVKERYESEILEISNKNNENQRYIESLRHQMHTQESELNDQDNYKGSYFALFDRIVHIFNIYSSKIPVYFNQKDEEQPKAKFDDPMEMLELLEKLIGISNDDKLVAYLRKIIINANLLQRKFFPENVNDKFNPEKIYDRISDLIQQLKGDILKQKTEINNLRISLEKEKSKMSMKCEIKFKERKRVHSAKPEQNNDLLPRRNAFF